jgi:hypothetical protein
MLYEARTGRSLLAQPTGANGNGSVAAAASALTQHVTTALRSMALQPPAPTPGGGTWSSGPTSQAPSSGTSGGQAVPLSGVGQRNSNLSQPASADVVEPPSAVSQMVVDVGSRQDVPQQVCALSTAEHFPYLFHVKYSYYR